MIRHARDLDFRAREIEIGRDDEQVVDACRQNFVGNRSSAEERVVKAFAFDLLHA